MGRADIRQMKGITGRHLTKKLFKLLPKAFFKLLDRLIDHAPVASDIELQVARIPRQQNGGNFTSPCVATSR